MRIKIIRFIVKALGYELSNAPRGIQTWQLRKKK
jgi:hypothetical protein